MKQEAGIPDATVGLVIFSNPLYKHLAMDR